MCMVEREGEGRGNCKSIVNGINFGQKKETHWITNIILDLFFFTFGQSSFTPWWYPISGLNMLC